MASFAVQRDSDPSTEAEQRCACRGCYRCVCVELRIHLLLLNAILQAPQLAECEGTVLEQSRGGRTLALLRSMLLGWASDAASKCAFAHPHRAGLPSEWF